MSLLFRSFLSLVLLATLNVTALAADAPTPIFHRSVNVDGIKVFFREAGDPRSPTLLLLHGYPSSSAMFQELISELADDYNVIAPDYPGFGFSDAPDRAQFRYTFENLTAVMDGFTEALGLERYALYLFDYGAPIGFRLAQAHPERVSALIIQNGNAYEEGFSPIFAGLLKVGRESPDVARATLKTWGLLTPQTLKAGHLTGVPDPTRVPPETYTLESALVARPGNDEIQYDLLLDYGSNVTLYPQFQAYLRTNRPPLLVLWGSNDSLFLPAGAEAFKRDVPKADVRYFDAGHFVLDTHTPEIADAIRGFLKKNK